MRADGREPWWRSIADDPLADIPPTLRTVRDLPYDGENPRDEARLAGPRVVSGSARWGALGKQFDLVRTADGLVYLTRWWLVKTPLFGIALHRMRAPDARETVHDHPWPFVSFVLRGGGYTERRLDPKTMGIRAHRVERVNVMPMGHAHSILLLHSREVWTLLVVGRYRRTWGFWEERATGEPLLGPARPGWARWWWTRHDQFDSGHYAP